MAQKNSSGIQALQNMNNTAKNTTTIEPKSAADDTAKNPTHKAPKQEKKKPEYLRLDVTDYKDYISLMAEHTSNTSGKYVSMTQYILRLIEADKQKKLETYEKLEQIERMKRELM